MIDTDCPFAADVRLYGHKIKDRIEEIEEVVDGYDEDVDPEAITNDIAMTHLLDEEEVANLRKELAALKELAEVGGDSGHFIKDDDFEKFAEEFADEIGAINRDVGWPMNCIDWKAAAEQLKMDYESVEFMGSTYYYRPE